MSSKPKFWSFNIKFIKEIQKRPPLWDTTIAEYFNKPLKDQLWNDITNVLMSKHVNVLGREKCVEMLQSRWKNLRSGFSKELARIEKLKSGSTTERKNQYIYYNELCFLYKTLKNKPQKKDREGYIEGFDMWYTMDEANQGPTIISPNNNMVNVNNNDKTKIRFSAQNDVIDILSDIEDSSPSGHGNMEYEPPLMENSSEAKALNDSDSDLIFLQSLIEPLKNIPKCNQFPTKIKIMQLIEEASKINSSTAQLNYEWDFDL